MKSVSLAWLWKNTSHSDVDLRVCVTPHIRPAVYTAAGSSAPTSSPALTSTTITTTPVHVGRPSSDAAAPPAINAAVLPAATAAAVSMPPHTPQPGSLPVSDTCVRSFRLHAVVLASSGSYFRTRLHPEDVPVSRKRPRTGSVTTALRYADTLDTGGGNPDVLLVEHITEGELDAFEAVLRHCYTASLVEDAGSGGGGGTAASAAQLSVALLLQMAVLADRFDVQPCMVHSCDELATRGAAAYDLAACETVLSSLPPGLQGLATIRSATKAATERLLQLLGDCEAVCGARYDADSTLHAQLLGLSLHAVLALLSSNALQARSENSVLVMADAWVNGPAGAACSVEQRRQVAEVVRLGQLSRAFTFDVLPAMLWLRLSRTERRSLRRFSAAGPDEPAKRAAVVAAAHTSVQAALLRDKYLSGPPLWFSASPRAAWAGPDRAVLKWELSRAQLELKLTTAATNPADTLLPRCFFNGFVVRMHLGLRLTAMAAAQTCTLGHGAAVLVGRVGALLDVPVWNAASEAEVGVLDRDTVGLAGSGVYVGSKVCISMSSRVHTQALRFPRVAPEQLLSIAAWQPYLQADGHLRMQMIVTKAE